jgi:hypothetical protein
VIACLALFAALGGTATAARLITSKQIKNNTITGKDVRNGSLTRGDLGFSTAMRVTTVDGPELTLQPGQTSYEVEHATGQDLRANCPNGTSVIGTGFDGGIGETDFVLSYESFVGGFFTNDTSIDYTVQVQAVCGGGSVASAVSARGRAHAERSYQADLGAAARR